MAQHSIGLGYVNIESFRLRHPVSVFFAGRRNKKSTGRSSASLSNSQSANSAFFPGSSAPTRTVTETRKNRQKQKKEMASLATHFSAFLFLLPIGIRRLVCSSSLYLRNPSRFKSKPWYFSNPKWKNLDLYILSIVLPIASFCQLFIFFSFSGHSTYRFSFFQQSASLIVFWALIILFILRENIDPFLVNESFVFVLAGIAFLVEYSVIGKGITGLGIPVYELLAQLTLLCVGSCLVLSVRPNAFFAEFLLSCGLVFKGSWLLQAGLCLHTDIFALKGCHKMVVSPGSPDADVHCDLEEDGLRGVALVNLLFVVHTIVVSIVAFLLFGMLSTFRTLRCGEASGPLLAELESESMLMRPSLELEME